MSDDQIIETIKAALVEADGGQFPPMGWIDSASRVVLAALRADGLTVARLEPVLPDILEWNDVQGFREVPVYRIVEDA